MVLWVSFTSESFYWKRKNIEIWLLVYMFQICWKNWTILEKRVLTSVSFKKKTLALNEPICPIGWTSLSSAVFQMNLFRKSVSNHPKITHSSRKKKKRIHFEIQKLDKNMSWQFEHVIWCKNTTVQKLSLQ